MTAERADAPPSRPVTTNELEAALRQEYGGTPTTDALIEMWMKERRQIEGFMDRIEPKVDALLAGTARSESEPLLPNPIYMARFFHETYERLAPQFGYETRADTKTFDHESPNGRLMAAVCEEFRKEVGMDDSALDEPEAVPCVGPTQEQDAWNGAVAAIYKEAIAGGGVITAGGVDLFRLKSPKPL